MTQNELDEKFIERANELAIIAKSKGEDPFGAVLVRNNEVLYEAHDGCTLYSSTEPCSMCSGAIHWAKISRLVFGIRQEILNIKSNGVKKFSSKDILERCGSPIEVTGPVLETECLNTFEGYKFVLKKERINQKANKNKVE